MIPTDTIDKLAETFAAISALGAGLTEEQWKTATDLPGWTVQDNLSHLVGTERMMQGLPATEHRADAGDYVRNPIGEWNEHEVDVRRAMPGADVLREWDELTALRLATLRAGDDDYFAVEAITPTGPGTVADFLHIRVLDCWAHEQDMRRAVGIPGSLDTASAAHTIDRLIRTLGIVVGKRAGTPEGATVRIVLTGPVERDLSYTVTDGRAGPSPDGAGAAVTTVRLDSEAFAVLALGRRPAAAYADRITLEGDTALGQRIVDALNMMI